MKTLLGLALAAWLIIGVVVASQRGFFDDNRTLNCRSSSNLALTIVAGPFNYAGIHPKVSCHKPHLSK